MEKLLRWQKIVSRAVTQGVVQGGRVEEITEGGPSFADEDVTQNLEVVSEPQADNEWGIGYVRGIPVLYSLDGPEGPEAYPVPEGFIHEQVYQGYAWEVERAEITWDREERPGWDGTGTIAESWSTVLDGYGCRIDRFESGGWAYTVDYEGNPLQGAENEAADSFDDAERAVVARIMEALI